VNFVTFFKQTEMHWQQSQDVSVRFENKRNDEIITDTSLVLGRKVS
jgi:hypothetical protein